MKLIIPIVIRLQDNGDGGYTMFVYNDEEEMLADHPLTANFDPVQKKFVKVELSKEQKEEILEQYDPYTNGYLDKRDIIVDYDPITQTARLSEHLCFHGGQ